MPYVHIEFSDLEVYEICGVGRVSVYRALWKSQDREVAVKPFPTLDIEDEAELLSQLSHKHIIKFYGAVNSSPNFCLVTEYAAKGSLFDYIAHNTLDFPQILRWSKEIALGVNYLHNEAPFRVIHRDLKSKNVVICSDLTVKLCDFGASRYFTGTTKMTQVGTWRWMAPEVIESKPVSQASDTFSYAVVMWEMLTQEVPFKSLNDFQVMWLVASNEERLTIPSSCPAPFATLMRKCWLTDPKERPSFPKIISVLDSMAEVAGLQEETESYLTQKKEWKKEIESSLEKLKKLEKDLGTKEKELQEREIRLLKKEKDIEQQAYSKVVSGIMNLYNDVVTGSKDNVVVENNKDEEKCPRCETASDNIPMNRDKQETEGDGEVQGMLIPDRVHSVNRKDEVKEPVKEDETMEPVSSLFINLLKKYGGNPLKPNANDKTCVDTARDGYLKSLKALIETPIEQIEVKPQLPWEQKSLRHRSMLAQVANQQKSEKIETFHFHRHPIGSGAFGHVHVGINGKDGREIAVKRMDLLQLDYPEDKEIQHLLHLKDCEQIVKYHSCCKDKYFLYIFFELMEGSLDELVCHAQDHVELCTDVMKGLDFLHKNNVLHRDLKPGNILYKTEPRLCLKLADFGLSTKENFVDFNASTGRRTVMHSKAGTRCWMAPEILSVEHSNSRASDVFGAGLVLYYIMAEKKHAFGPKDETGLNEAEIQIETERNITTAQLNFSEGISPEAFHLLMSMLRHNKDRRPTTGDCLTHPFFWSKVKKKEFLCAVGNQPEINVSRPVAIARGLTSLELDLETELGAEFLSNPWNTTIPQIYLEITSMPRARRYCTTSAVDLVKFVKNSYSHVSDVTRSRGFQLELLDRFVYFDRFPALLITVYDIVMKYRLNSRAEINCVLQQYS